MPNCYTVVLISDFWDVQAGVRYRHEVNQQEHQTDREGKV